MFWTHRMVETTTSVVNIPQTSRLNRYISYTDGAFCVTLHISWFRSSSCTVRVLFAGCQVLVKGEDLSARPSGSTPLGCRPPLLIPCTNFLRSTSLWNSRLSTVPSGKLQTGLWKASTLRSWLKVQKTCPETGL